MATNQQVIPSTGPVASSSHLTCAHCARRGHRCPADRMDDGTATCIWCLDNLPCAYEQRQKREQVSGAASHDAPRRGNRPEAGLKPAGHPVVSSRGNAAPEKPPSPQRFDADFVEKRMAEHRAASKQNAPEKPVAVPLPPSPKLPEPEEAPTMAATTQTKTNGHDATPPPRLCLCGCGATVPASNRFAYIKGHMKRQGKTAKGVKRGPYNTKKKTNGRETAAAVAELLTPTLSTRQAEPPRVALQVTEPQLNDFLLKLSFEDKQWLANHYLREFHL